MKALTILRNEQQAIRAVLHTLMFSVMQIRDGKAQPDFTLLGAAIYYLDTFWGRIHRTKLEEHVYGTVQARQPHEWRLFTEARRTHSDCLSLIRLVGQGLVRYQYGGDAELAGFAAYVADYASLHRQLLDLHEHRIFQLAATHLTPDDWTVVDAAFARHRDRVYGDGWSAHYDAVLCRIAQHCPAVAELDAVLAGHSNMALEDAIGDSPYSTDGGMTEPAAKPGSPSASTLTRIK